MSHRTVVPYPPMTKAELIRQLNGIPDDTKIIISCPVICLANGKVQYDEEATARETLYFAEDKELYIIGEVE